MSAPDQGGARGVGAAAVAFEVRARLGSGVAHASPWGISLDGLLASQIRADAKSVARERGVDHPVYDPDNDPEEIDLPLARCTAAGPADWHWCATFAFPVDEVEGPHVHYWSARPDQYPLDQLAGALPMHVSERQGRYRSRVMPLPLTIARELVWRGVGNPDRVRGLLGTIASIGKKRSAGHGRVMGWEVTAVGDDAADRWEYAHLHPDGTLGRTTPHGCLAGRQSVRTGDAAVMGVRPPYMHPGTRREAFLPHR